MRDVQSVKSSLRISLIWNYERSQLSNIIVIQGVTKEFF